MKKEYLSPEIEVIKFSFEPLLSMVQSDNGPEDFESSGDFGDDNILWIIPLIKKTEVWHNPGPYDGLRFTYDILRNREENKEIYLNCLEKFINLFSVSVSYRGEKQKNLEKDGHDRHRCSARKRHDQKTNTSSTCRHAFS